MSLRPFGSPLLLIAVAACTNEAAVAKQTASPDLHCPQHALSVKELESDRYRVTGCKKSGVYHCLVDQCWREGWFAKKARERATREFACPARQVSVRWIQEETYRVEACGEAVTYSCDDESCVPEGARARAPTVVPIPIIVR
jgi:hypothetical protein